MCACAFLNSSQRLQCPEGMYVTVVVGELWRWRCLPCLCVCLWWISFISRVSHLLWVRVCMCEPTQRECVSDMCVSAGPCVCVRFSHIVSTYVSLPACMCLWPRVCLCVSVWQCLSDGSSIACSMPDRFWVSIAGGNSNVCVQSNVCWQARWTSYGYDDLNLLQVTPAPPLSC